ncbi:E3 ubiquitin-protein ligase ZNF598 [Pelomyxa schiedti]|nr:E3 ubiquitin-protein ligase ZNF598 [Pelomyxa schiedti]
MSSTSGSQQTTPILATSAPAVSSKPAADAAPAPPPDTSSTTATSTSSSSSSSGGGSEVGSCVICCEERMDVWSVGTCNHPAVCALCSLKLWLLYNQRECCMCKEPQKCLVITSVRGKTFQQYVPLAALPHDPVHNIYFSSVHLRNQTWDLLSQRCPICSPLDKEHLLTPEPPGAAPSAVATTPASTTTTIVTTSAHITVMTTYKDPKAPSNLNPTAPAFVPSATPAPVVFQTNYALRGHLWQQHRVNYCDICLTDRHVFLFEQVLLKAEEVAAHNETWDGGISDTLKSKISSRPKAHKRANWTPEAKQLLQGHPQCGFCGARVYNGDALYHHLHANHTTCPICEGNDIYWEFYCNYQELERHYREVHFLCEEKSCLEQKHIVFASQVDLKAHQISEHSVKNTQLALNFSIRRVGRFGEGLNETRPYVEQVKEGRRREDYHRDTYEDFYSPATETSANVPPPSTSPASQYSVQPAPPPVQASASVNMTNTSSTSPVEQTATTPTEKAKDKKKSKGISASGTAIHNARQQPPSQPTQPQTQMPSTVMQPLPLLPQAQPQVQPQSTVPQVQQPPVTTQGRKIPELPVVDAKTREEMNAQLLQSMREIIGEEGLVEFKKFSSQFKHNTIDTTTYHTTFFALFGTTPKSEQMFTQLVATLPDSGKRNDLWALHTTSQQQKQQQLQQLLSKRKQPRPNTNSSSSSSSGTPTAATPNPPSPVGKRKKPPTQPTVPQTSPPEPPSKPILQPGDFPVLNPRATTPPPPPQSNGPCSSSSSATATGTSSAQQFSRAHAEAIQNTAVTVSCYFADGAGGNKPAATVTPAKTMAEAVAPAKKKKNKKQQQQLQDSDFPSLLGASSSSSSSSISPAPPGDEAPTVWTQRSSSPTLARGMMSPTRSLSPSSAAVARSSSPAKDPSGKKTKKDKKDKKEPIVLLKFG